MDTGTPTRPHTTIRARGRRTERTAAAVLAIGALAGCASDRSPTQTTSPPASSAITVPTPGPSATASTGAPTSPSGTATGFDVVANMPTAAKQHTNAGAQAFARYYIEAYGRLLMDPAKGQLPKLYLPKCAECDESEQNIASTADQAVRWNGLYYQILDVTEPDNGRGELVDSAHESQIHVVALLTTVPVTVKVGTAAPTTRPPDGNVLVDFSLSWQDGQWYVADFRSDSATPAPR